MQRERRGVKEREGGGRRERGKEINFYEIRLTVIRFLSNEIKVLEK